MRYAFAVIIAVLLSSAPSTLDAQIQVRLNFNLDSQPAWGPTGYDYVDYYYLPDIEAYYNVPQHRYYYNERGRWISSYNLPSRFRGFDFYNSYKVVVNEREPWRHHESYRDKYASFKSRHDQQPIRDSQDSKYFVNKNHPQHNNWLQQQKRNSGNKGNSGNGGKKDDKQKNDRGKRDGKGKQ